MNKIKNVVLIDDSRAINSRNESLLKDLNIFENIVKYTDSAEALEVIKDDLKKDKTALPDIIFLDLEMPEMDGFAFLEKYILIEEIVKSDYQPIVIIVTDHLNFRNFEKSKYYKSYGVLDQVKKPIDKEDVLALLDEHFENFKALI